MKTRLNILIIFIVLISFRACGQYFQFSQNNFATQRFSPSSSASSDYAAMSYIYRNQGTGGNLVINSHLLSGSLPLISSNSGKRWGGIGITLMDDRSSPVYQLQEASLSYAVNAALNRTQSIALGVKTLYHKRALDVAALDESGMFLSDRGLGDFDSQNPARPEIEVVTLSSGFHWQYTNTDGVRVGYVSAAMLDIYSPDVFTDAPEINSTFVGAGSFRAFKTGNLSVFPDALYTKSKASDLLSIGLVTRCDVQINAQSPDYYVNVITKYQTNRSGILGLQYHSEVFSLGVSYEVPLQEDNMTNIGAFEIGLEIRRLVKPEFKNKTLRRKLDGLQKAIASKPKSAATSSASTSSEAHRLPTEEIRPKTLHDRIISKRDSVLQLKMRSGKPLEIDHQILKINFGFNSVKMDTATTRYLDELAKTLKSDRRLRVRLTGHTDNIGAPSVNYQLSLHRANAARAYLVQQGVSPSIIRTEGKGMAQPLNENKNEQQRARNRRVEVKILFQE